MDLELNLFKNEEMPNRRISPQSFDEILSDLGDDPAIPDPQGIRKSSPKKFTTPELSQKIKTSPFQYLGIDGKNINFWLFGLFGIHSLAILLAIFWGYETLKSSSTAGIKNTHNQITELKKEISSLQDQMEELEDYFDETIDKLEVSIHSNIKNPSYIKTLPKPQGLSHEPELRAWRYLGMAQMGASQQAFFHDGKKSLTLEMDAQALGEWRLTNIQKDGATLTHQTGKLLILKTSKSQ
jgi:hypothetical protein